MALGEEQINKVISEFVENETAKKRDNPSHRIFLSEDSLINKLNATSDEDIKNIRICASSYIDAFNSVSRPEFHIESNIDEYNMARAKAFREQEIEPSFVPRKSGCLSIIGPFVIALCIIMFFTL